MFWFDIFDDFIFEGFGIFENDFEFQPKFFSGNVELEKTII